MPINLEFESLDGLPDSLKAVLVEREGKYVLEGETSEEVRGLKSAHEREKATAKQLADKLRQQAEMFKDIDPEKAREALRQIQDLEEKGLRDAGKVDELIEKRLATLRAEHDRREQGLTQERDDWREKYGTLVGQYQSEKIDGALRDAMGPLVKPEHHADVANRLRLFWRFSDDGQMVPMRQGKDGQEIIWGRDPTKPISMSEQIEALLKDVPVFSLPSSGGGASNGVSLSGNGRVIALNAEQARNPTLYREAKEQAAKAGLPLQIVEP